ncbi:hypothetical protein EDD15DRAFT_2376936 [Pisolithus albus]|nr:hypothetical protein EDD15DRAFT_2376936 [Pisolithus albus]
MGRCCATEDGHAQRQGTPVSHPQPPATSSSTPIKPRKPADRLFSTFTRYRHPTLNSIGKNMIGSMVGPMPIKDFLESFFPTYRIPRYCSMANLFQKGVSFERTLKATGKLDMYEPFIEEIKPFAPQLHFVDSHARGDKKNGYDFEIKPDVSVYHESLDGPVPAGCDISNLDMHIEFKWHRFDDPFLAPSDDDRDQVAFLGSSDTQQDTLGQIGAYAAAQLASQLRTHAFSLYILHDTACIIRWDREGTIVTEPISYTTDSSLVEFISRYSKAPPELRGVDTLVSRPSKVEATSARAKLGLLADVPMFKTAIPGSDDGSPLSVIFTLPDVLSSTPTCRGTRACPAYDPSGDHVVFFKDSWQVNGPDMIPEGKIYAELNKNGIPHVPTCLASGDVRCWPEQEMQTKKYAGSPWACRQGLSITSHTHYWLILDVVGERLTNFTSSRELVQAIHDALVAHKLAYALGLLHRDISTGNIIIFRGRGYLIDWDLAKATNVIKPRQVTCTGTWQFMSAHLVKDASATHTFKDDLESSFWVLLWTVVMFSKSSFSIEERSNFIRGTFESTPGGEGKRSMLVSQQKLKRDLFPDRPSLYQLLKDLADLFAYDYHVPTDSEWDLLVPFENPSLREITLMEALPIFHHKQSVERLQNHNYVIGCFATHLNSGTWPENDAAVMQLLMEINCWGEEGSGNVGILKSKHILDRVLEEEEEEERSRKRARPRRKRRKKCNNRT